MKLALAVTGASGVGLAKRFIEYLPDSIELHVAAYKNAGIVSACENKKIFFHDDENIASSISSGS